MKIDGTRQAVMSWYGNFIRPILFQLDPEWIHNATIRSGELIGNYSFLLKQLDRRFRVDDPKLEMKVAGLTFSNPVGLAAGFDKNGKAVRGLSAFGFGSVEVGSVSAQASEGNPRPRLFRLLKDEAIVVSYGVPNEGAAVVSERLSSAALDIPLGVNLVETNTGREASADLVIEEFVTAAKKFVGVADYLTLSLNCPNTTAGGSVFDDPKVLGILMQEYRNLANLPPVFLKFTATSDNQRINGILEAVANHPFIKGFIFNLPSGKNYSLNTPQEELDRMPGALCGRPSREMMDDAVKTWFPLIDPSRHVIMGSGGIFTADDAYRKIKLGASLLQLYTALVFHGPGLIRKINEGLCERLERDGYSHLSEAVGTGL